MSINFVSDRSLPFDADAMIQCLLYNITFCHSKACCNAEQCKDEGNKCMKEGKHTEAILHYTEAIKHEPNSAVLHSNRSLAFLKVDQLYLAMEDAQKAIQLQPSWPKGFFRKGEIEYKGGQYGKALMSYKQALLLDPTDEGISNAISRTNKEMAKDRKEAAQKPVMYTCVGILLGVAIVAADQFIAVKPSIQFTALQVLVVAGCGGLGFAASKVYRYMQVTQREALLEEPIDLLGEFDKGKDSLSNDTGSSASHKHHSQASGRQKMKKGKTS